MSVKPTLNSDIKEPKPQQQQSISSSSDDKDSGSDVDSSDVSPTRMFPHLHAMLLIKAPYGETEPAWCNVCSTMLSPTASVYHCQFCTDYDECSNCYNSVAESDYLQQMAEAAIHIDEKFENWSAEAKEIKEHYELQLSKTRVREYDIGTVIPYSTTLKGVNPSITVPFYTIGAKCEKVPALVLASRPNHPLTQPEALQRKLEIAQQVASLDHLMQAFDLRIVVYYNQSNIMQKAISARDCLTKLKKCDTSDSFTEDQKRELITLAENTLKQYNLAHLSAAKLRQSLKNVDRLLKTEEKKASKFAKQHPKTMELFEREMYLIDKYFKYLPKQVADATPLDAHPVTVLDQPMIDFARTTDTALLGKDEKTDMKSDEKLGDSTDTESDSESATSDSTTTMTTTTTVVNLPSSAAADVGMSSDCPLVVSESDDDDNSDDEEVSDAEAEKDEDEADKEVEADPDLNVDDSELEHVPAGEATAANAALISLPLSVQEKVKRGDLAGAKSDRFLNDLKDMEHTYMDEHFEETTAEIAFQSNNFYRERAEQILTTFRLAATSESAAALSSPKKNRKRPAGGSLDSLAAVSSEQAAEPASSPVKALKRIKPNTVPATAASAAATAFQ